MGSKRLHIGLDFGKFCPVRWDQLCKLGRELPEVSEGLWYRTSALGVRGRFFVRLKEDGQSVAFRLENLDEQEFLTKTRAEVFYITEHYRGYPAVLARLVALSTPECRARLETAWRAVAPPALVKRRNEAFASGRPAAGTKGVRARPKRK
jgi:hypothetical protein